MRKIITIFILYFLFANFSHGQGRLTGYYVSRFVYDMFFMTQIQLNKDSSFVLQKVTDLSNYSETGKYSFSNDTLILKCTPNNDSIYPKSWYTDTLEKGFAKIFPNLKKNGDTLKFYHKNNRLYVIQNNEIKYTAGGPGTFRRFLFWGERNYRQDRKYYLKKKRHHKWTDW